MAKLTRVPAKVFAASAAATEIGQFGSAVAGSKLETSDVATIQGLSAWLDGWSEALVSGNRYPALQEMNGLLKVLSYQGAYALQEGIAEYDAATTYYIGSIVKKTGTFKLYGSLTNDNVGNALTVDTEWKFLVDLNTVGQNITQIGSSATASATAEKAVTLSGFVLATGATLLISCSNANTASAPTLNVNGTGAKALKFKDGIAVDATHPAPINMANRGMLVLYNGTDYIIQENAIYNSGWFEVTHNTSYTKAHGLATKNIKWIIQIATDINGLNSRPSLLNFQNSTAWLGTIPAPDSDTTIRFTTGAYVGADELGQALASAYYKILAEAL